MKKFLSFLVLLCLVISPFQQPNVDAKTLHHSKLYEQGMEYMKKRNFKAAIQSFKGALEQYKMGAYYHNLAKAYEADEQYENAALTYYKEAEIFKDKDINTYFALLEKGNLLKSELSFYMETNATTTQSLQKHEPQAGTYIGAYIEQDSEVSHEDNRYKKFNELTGKQHATFFRYHRFGDPFPSKWANDVKAEGGAIHIALEPYQGLSAVKDDAYLRQFAKEAKATGMPIFLRYASEMNGSWVKWHGNPSEYIKKFQLVSKVMKEEAPNVAMVWIVSEMPLRNIEDYYPGDAYVDWVGLNLYSVRFFNGDPKQSAVKRNPLDAVESIYNLYADRKPIMLGEYGATHYSKAGNIDTSDFAITKMNMLYHGVKLKFPRVKKIQWFSVDTLTEPNVNRRLNNFSLLDNAKVLAAYKKMISDNYFLSKVQSVTSTNRFEEINNTAFIQGKVTLQTWVKTYDPFINRVDFFLDNKKIASSNQYPYPVTIDGNTLTSGGHQLTAKAYDSKGRVAISKTITVRKAPKLASNQIRLYLNNKSVLLANGSTTLLAAPFEKNGRSLVPIRFISEQMDAKVDWNSKEQKVTITKGSKKVVIQINSTVGYMNGNKNVLDSPPLLKQGTTFVPLRFVSDALGAKISFNGKDKSIDILK